MKQITAFYTATICAGLYFVFLAFFSSLSYNLNTPNYAVKQLFNLSAPEGWGFFTRSPREEMVDVYAVENNKIKKFMQKNGHYSNFFGVSRLSRTIGMETSILLSKVNDSMWSDNVDISNIKIPSQNYTLDNESLHFLKSGDYVFVKRKTVPWAWRKNVQQTNIPYEITHIKVAAID